MEVGPNLFHASGTRPQDIRQELVAICLARDEMWRMPFFFAYHRWLGVQHFIVIDNRSKDGTPDFLQREHDVTCILAPGEYGGRPKGQRTWLSWALRLAPPERWNLVLDADELFVGSALGRGHLLSLVRALDAEGAAIVATTLVDCYPAEFPPAAHFEPVPWQRAPYFDRGPYFEWPASTSRIHYLHHGVRERVCWPHWRWARHLRKAVPRPLRPRLLSDPPPWVIKMPLLRNVPGFQFHSVHQSSGGPRSRSLFALLHYKVDIDLSQKVELALRERQYTHGSREYAGYARMLSKGCFDLRYEGSCRFEGVQSLVDAGLVAFGDLVEDRISAGDPPLCEIAEQVSQYADRVLQKQIWERAWGLEATTEQRLDDREG